MPPMPRAPSAVHYAQGSLCSPLCHLCPGLDRSLQHSQTGGPHSETGSSWPSVPFKAFYRDALIPTAPTTDTGEEMQAVGWRPCLPFHTLQMFMSENTHHPAHHYSPSMSYRSDLTAKRHIKRFVCRLAETTVWHVTTSEPNTCISSGSKGQNHVCWEQLAWLWLTTVYCSHCQPGKVTAYLHISTHDTSSQGDSGCPPTAWQSLWPQVSGRRPSAQPSVPDPANQHSVRGKAISWCFKGLTFKNSWAKLALRTNHQWWFSRLTFKESYRTQRKICI